MSNYGPRIEPGFWDDDRVQELMQGDDADRRALLMLLEVRSYCMAAESDGFIGTVALRRASVHPDPQAGAARLEGLGLAEKVMRDGREGWQIDWSDQLTTEKINKTRRDKADWDRHLHGNHAACGNHRGYRCHTNGDYKRYMANLGNHLDHLDEKTDSTRPDSTRPERGVGDVRDEERKRNSSSTDETDSALARSAARGSSSPGSGSGAPDMGSDDPWAGEDEDFDFDDWETADVSAEVFEQALERELQLIEKHYRAVPDSVEFKIKGTMIEARLVEPLWRVVKNWADATPYDRARIDAAEEVVLAVFDNFAGVEWDEDSDGFPYRARITTTRRSSIVHDLDAMLSKMAGTCAERKREARAVEKAMSELAALPVDAATITEAGAMVEVNRDGLWVEIRFAGRLPQLWRAFRDTGDLPAHDRQLLAAAARIRRSFSMPPTPDDDYDWTVSLITDGRAGIEEEIRGRLAEALEQARREAEVGVG
ncbi:hypothetical protein [Nocardia asiatica]|uniref:hypothetical protein n=1 Tax=Nocardia asiatica TaxID=209252 RepID=UPI0002ED195B|nr:hypothetical protein [Nocardia asiatica]